ncbi:MAG: aldehyde dehydrogenase (NADP(+)) [Planctomycetes bacterium]|nr:aldehyde dehydrogenase (NADP(+)) [Planctomycetota bacterium]
MDLHGKNIINGDAVATSAKTFTAVNPATATALTPAFHEASLGDADRAAKAANEAYATYRRTTPEARAAFLEKIAAEIEALGDELIQRANAETGLPEARLQGERGRTTSQLRAFAALVKEGSWVDARIDRALPERKPLPRPDVRRMLMPIGPVLVYGASNFPLAFSAAGGDTASALAGGNTVVLKAHPAHPGTSELVMHAVAKAIVACGLPKGTVNLIQAVDTTVSTALVQHPLIQAVGFTGSLGAGRAIYNVAAARPVPIPVYSEMGSINPVFILPGALAERGKAIAEGFVASLTMGVGQFCTNPGVVVALKSPQLDQFLADAGALVTAAAPGTMLYDGIRTRYESGVAALAKRTGVTQVAAASAVCDPKRTQAGARLFRVSAAAFLADAHLREEVFGPASVLVECGSLAEMEQVAGAIPGQLTGTLHTAASDLSAAAPIADALAQRVGRILWNGFPTGVEVCPAMVHGGPYPATTDARSTSVGTAAIERFVRPVCFQNAPQELLPVELQNANPRGVWRTLDGEFSKNAV